MRRDVFIRNDSGALSVLAGAAVDAIVEDGRQDDLKFVHSHQALLLELYGDDSMPVRLVVDEPLSPAEQAQWLARASGRVDAPDGRLLVMGGFDPDVLADWNAEQGPDQDGDGVAVVQAAPGIWRVDVYAHVGSMNGRQVLREAGEALGAAFRRGHPGRAFPVWLAKALEFSGEEDPGHEELWREVARSLAEGRLGLDTGSASAVGFLVHVTPLSGELAELPADGWFARDAGRRVPGTFPLGLPAEVADPELESFLDRVLARSKPAPEPTTAPAPAEIIEVWGGDPSRRIEGGERALPLAEAHHLYWMAALTADSPPHFELWISPRGPWTPPAASEDLGVVSKGGSTWALGPTPDCAGWSLWRAARRALATLVTVPEGSTLDLAMAPRDPDDDAGAAIGRALYGGRVAAGSWQLAESSPALPRDVLDEALSFVKDLEGGRLTVRGEADRSALEAAAAIHSPEEGSLVWEGDSARLAEPDERTLLLLAAPVFRTRFGATWPCDPIEEGW